MSTIKKMEVPLDDLKKDLLRKVHEAEKAAYAYFSKCEVGEERAIAYEVYERIRNSTWFG